MIADLSMLYSDNVILENPMTSIYAQRDMVATRYGDTPYNVEEYDPIAYTFGVVCPSGENMAMKRIQAKKKAEANM